jgi:murein DD-endopeptidase MepM/ murein hydrolase activator NlpD
VKKILLLLTLTLVGVLAWIAAGSDKIADDVRTAKPRAASAAPPISPPATKPTVPLGGQPLKISPPIEPAVPPVIMGPIAMATAPPAVVANETTPAMQDADAPRPIIIPVAGVDRRAMRDMFDEVRGNRRHEAIDILAPRGTPVIATDDGVVKKLFTSVPGGLTVYEFDPDERFCYYYAHLDRYAAGLHEGQVLHRGEVLGYVGTTGNAPRNAPHLHFALIRLDPDRRWWKGTYVNPYPLLQ